MKIAYVCPFYAPAIGGVKQVVEELAERYIKEGHEVHVFTSDWDKEKRIKKKEEIINGVKVHRCWHIFRVANFATVWPSLLPKLLKEDFDIIHSHLFAHAHFILASIAAKITNIPHIHTTHCPWSDAHRSFIGKIYMFVSYNIFSRIALKFANKIIAITPWEINFIKKYGGRDNQIEVIPNGMDMLFFKKVKKNNFKKKHGIKKKLILFFGRYNQTKSPDHFVLMAKEILKHRKDVDFIMIGPDEGEFKKVKEMAKGEKKIQILGPLRGKDKIVEMYQAADVYVLSSYREGLPLTLFEAMASGLPIVATPVNGVPYEIKNNENGFLIKWNNIKKLSEAVEKILDNKKLAEKFRKNNLKKAKNYSWDIIAGKIMNIYRKAIKK